MRAFRGTILNPRSETQCAVYPDGLVVVNDAGQVAAIGPTDSVTRRFGPGALEVVESSPFPWILPAFTDLHLHWVQNRIKGTAHGQGLTAWLEECVWPEERKFAEPGYCREAAAQFFADLARHGTLAGAVYSSIHDAALEAFEPPFGHFAVGNVLMPEHAPASLPQTAADALATAGRWAEKLGADSRAPRAYAVSPRFAPMCSMNLMERAAQIAARHRCFIQTHLAENLEEVGQALERFPECRNYTGVYHQAGLLGPRTLLGHCIYLGDDELEMIRSADAVIAHCPTANEALGSGRMPIERVRKAGIRWALGTDVGAGPSLSMPGVMKSFLRVHAAAGLRFNPREALYRATLAGAEILGLSGCCGNLDVGREANIALFDPPEPPHARDADEAVSSFLGRLDDDGTASLRQTYYRGRLCPQTA